MYLESIMTLSEKEAQLRQKSEDEALLAKKAVADAKADGEACVKGAADRADAEVKQMIAAVHERAKSAAAEKAASTENKKAVLRARAERNTEKAVSLIVERIVNG